MPKAFSFWYLLFGFVKNAPQHPTYRFETLSMPNQPNKIRLSIVLITTPFCLSSGRILNWIYRRFCYARSKFIAVCLMVWPRSLIDLDHSTKMTNRD